MGLMHATWHPCPHTLSSLLLAAMPMHRQNLEPRTEDGRGRLQKTTHPQPTPTSTWKPILLLIFFMWFGISGCMSAWVLHYCGCCCFCFFFFYELQLCDSFLCPQSFTGSLVPSILWWLQNLPHSVGRDIPEQVSLSSNTWLASGPRWGAEFIFSTFLSLHFPINCSSRELFTATVFHLLFLNGGSTSVPG